MQKTFTKKHSSLRDKLRNIALLLAATLLIIAILLTIDYALFYTEDFVIFTSPHGGFKPLLLLMAALPFYFIGINVQDEHHKFTFREIMVMCLLFISLIGNIGLPFILEKKSETAISELLRDMNLYGAITTWTDNSGDQSANNINLADLSPLRSAVIVNGPSFDFQGATMRISEFNDLLPSETRAFGVQNLRYVIVINEVQAGETLSAKWEAYYKRGWEVGEPTPVKYIHIDWQITLVDILSERILNKVILSPEPPSDSRRPLSSEEEIRPSKEALKLWMGFK